MPKIYTKTGDKGTSSLYDGSRCLKSDNIFDIMGEIDELSSRIGYLCSLLQLSELETFNICRDIQQNLQNINSIIATIDSSKLKLPSADYMNDTHITKLEQHIDIMQSDLPTLTKFILAGVAPPDAQAHLCRTQTRKVERCLYKLKFKDHNERFILLDEQIYVYMNRLSDFFFVLARWLCQYQGLKDFSM